MSETKTWRKEITRALVDMGESWSDVASCVLSEAALDADFDEIGGGENRICGLVLRTSKRPYFLMVYNGDPFVGGIDFADVN